MFQSCILPLILKERKETKSYQSIQSFMSAVVTCDKIQFFLDNLFIVSSDSSTVRFLVTIGTLKKLS